MACPCSSSPSSPTNRSMPNWPSRGGSPLTRRPPSPLPPPPPPLPPAHPLKAQLAESRGLAHHLPRTLSSPANIAERLKALLEDKVLHTRLEQLAEELRQSPMRAPAIEALEQLALGPESLPGLAPHAPC